MTTPENMQTGGELELSPFGDQGDPDLGIDERKPEHHDNKSKLPPGIEIGPGAPNQWEISKNRDTPENPFPSQGPFPNN